MTFTKILTSWDDIGNIDTAYKLLAATIRTCKVARHVCFQRGIKATSFLSDAYLANIVERLWELWKTGGSQPVPIPEPKGKGKVSEIPSVNPSTSAPPLATPNIVRSHASLAPAPAPSPSVHAAAAPDGSAVAASSSSTDKPAGAKVGLNDLRALLQPLQKEELKSWIKSHNIVVPPLNKLRTKEDLVSGIIDACTDNPQYPQPSHEDIQAILELRKGKRAVKAPSVVNAS